MSDYSASHSLDNATLREQYRRAGFGGRVGWGDHVAVLVIDLAVGWTVRSAGGPGSDLSNIVQTTRQLLAVARATSTPVWFTTMGYDRADVSEARILSRKVPHCSALLRGTEAVMLAPELCRRPDEPLIEKPRSSAFFGTQLLGDLVERRVDTVVVAGCSTSGCIRATCESAFNYNFHVIVPYEAVGDRSPTAHQAALFDIDARFGDVVSLAHALRRLQAGRDHDTTAGPADDA